MAAIQTITAWANRGYRLARGLTRMGASVGRDALGLVPPVARGGVMAAGALGRSGQRLGAGAVRAAAVAEPLFHLTMKNTAKGWRIRSSAQAGMGVLGLGFLAYGAYGQYRQQNAGPVVEMNTGGLPEIRRRGDMGATGSLPLSLRALGGNYL